MRFVAVKVQPIQRRRRVASVDKLNLAVVPRRHRRQPLAAAADDGVGLQPPPRGQGRVHLERAVRAADSDLGGDCLRLFDGGVCRGGVAVGSRRGSRGSRLVRRRGGFLRLLHDAAAEHLHHLREVDLAVLADRRVVQLDEQRAVVFGLDLGFREEIAGGSVGPAVGTREGRALVLSLQPVPRLHHYRTHQLLFSRVFRSVGDGQRGSFVWWVSGGCFPGSAFGGSLTFLGMCTWTSVRIPAGWWFLTYNIVGR